MIATFIDRLVRRFAAASPGYNPVRCLAVAAVVLVALPAPRPPGGSTTVGHARPAPSRAEGGGPSVPLGHLPLQFEPNGGQAPSSVRFLLREPGVTLLLAPGRISFRLWSPVTHGAPSTFSSPRDDSSAFRVGENAASHAGAGDLSTATVTLRLIGADPRAKIVGEEPLPGRVNYFLGASPRDWHPDIPVYGGVLYRNIYPHIDLSFHGNEGRLEYDWLLHHGADVRDVRLQVSGGRLLSKAGGGMLIGTKIGTVEQRKPVLYQRIGPSLKPVVGGYVTRSDGAVGLWVGRYDPDQTLIVDPVLQYSTYLGGSNSDWGAGIAVDQRGDAYIIGSTESQDYPNVNAIPGQRGKAGETVVISKLNPSGNRLLYSTYLGAEADDDADSLALAPNGAVYVTGMTRSVAFPTVHPLPGSACNADPGHSGDVFVAELSPGGNHLSFSTCLGGSSTDWPTGIALDSSGAVYVAGSTSSDDFPTVHALQPRRQGGTDVFVTKFVHNHLAFSTYFGGSGDDGAGGIAVDAQGNLFLTGSTSSTDLPILNGVQPHPGGNADGGTEATDAFVAQITGAGRLAYSTYLGGKGDDVGTGIALDGADNVFVTGTTTSSDFPTVTAAQGTWGGGMDAFVTKLAASGRSIAYSTYLGGSDRDAATDVTVDSADNAYVVGTTASANFPVVSPIQAAYAGGYLYGDAFLTRLDQQGRPTFSTYLGGKGADIATSIALDPTGAAFITGGTSSTDFPITQGLAGTSPDRGNIFIAKVDFNSGAEPEQVTLDQVALFTRGKDGDEVRTRTVRPGHAALFVGLYHTVGVQAVAVHAALWFTSGSHVLARRTMRQDTSLDRRPLFTLTWHVPQRQGGTIVAHVQLSVGTVTATKTLRFTLAPR